MSFGLPRDNVNGANKNNVFYVVEGLITGADLGGASNNPNFSIMF